MLIDTHAHIISDDPAAYPPQPLSGQLRPGDLDNPMTAERLLRAMDSHDVERALLVQRAHVYGYDNSYVADMAERYRDRFQAVAVIDALTDNAGDIAKHWLVERNFAGIRLTEPFKGAPQDWFASARADAVWQAVHASGAFVCLQFYRWNRVACLEALPVLLGRYPGVNVVIDHLTSLVEENGAPDFGFDAPVMALSAFPRVSLKVTTINLARASANGVDPAALVEKANAVFGSARLMWGSDIAQSPQPYAQMVEMALAATGRLDAADSSRVLKSNALALFRA